MWRACLILASVLVMTLMAGRPTCAQASKKLEERSKGMEQGQQKSWQQVDEINKESDKTKARYQQSKQQSSQVRQKTAPVLKKTKVGTATGHKKPPASRKGPAPKKK